MARGDQLPGQQAAAAAELEHQALLVTYRGEELHDPRSARGRVGPEAPVMHGGEVRPEARAARGVHPAILALPVRSGWGWVRWACQRSWAWARQRAPGAGGSPTPSAAAPG